jgi:hypothetical protein
MLIASLKVVTVSGIGVTRIAAKAAAASSRGIQNKSFLHPTYPVISAVHSYLAGLETT